MPPQAERPNAKNNPDAINLTKDIFPLLNFIPETKRYIARNAKNNPNGSDLNQPISPLIRIGTDTAKINEANRPAVVPPNTRTNANTTMEVKDPITKGNKTVKSYNVEPKLKMG